MDKLINKVNRRTTTGVAATLISVSYLLSRVLGLFRDRVLASHFGIGPLADAYTAAFRLPDLLFTLLISGALAVAFIPVFAHLVEKDKGHREAWQLASDVLNLCLIATVVLGVLSAIFASPIVHLITPGFDPARHDLTVKLTRIMLLTPVIFALSSVWGSIAQAFNRFVFFAMAGVFYNVGIIVGIVVFGRTGSIEGVAWGVVVGALAQATVQVLGLAGLGYRYSPKLHLRNPELWRVVALMIPRSIDQGIDQVNYTVQTIVGSSLATGSLTAYYYANNLKNVPLVLFGSAIATAVFPTMAKDAAAGRIDKLIEGFVANMRFVLFLIIPAAAVTVILRGYIVRLLFGFGNAMTATTLGWFSGAIVATSIFFLVTRVFYALEDSKTPLYVSLFAITINIMLSFALGSRYGVAGLAMAQSMVAAAEVLILLLLLSRKLPSIGGAQIWAGFWRISLATAISGSVMYLLVVRSLPLYLNDLGFLSIGPKFALIALAGLVSYLVPCYLLRLREAKLFVARFHEQILKPLNILNQRND